MGTEISVFGAGFAIVFMVSCLASPAIGLVVDWVSRHRKHLPEVYHSGI